MKMTLTNLRFLTAKNLKIPCLYHPVWEKILVADADLISRLHGIGRHQGHVTILPIPGFPQFSDVKHPRSPIFFLFFLELLQEPTKNQNKNLPDIEFSLDFPLEKPLIID